jgi:hypothetical protein
MQNLNRRKTLISKSWRSSVVEQLTCNQQVGGSNPFASSITDGGQSSGEVAEWTKAADCKSAGVSLRRFESFPPHQFRLINKRYSISHEWTRMDTKKLFVKIRINPWLNNIFGSAIELAGVAQLARASAFQAEGRGFESRLPLQRYYAHVAQSAEHILGKDEVGGSSPPVGSALWYDN